MKNTLNTHSSDTGLQKGRCVGYTDPAFADEVARILKDPEQAYGATRAERMRGFQSRNSISLHSLASDSKAI